MKHLAVAVVLSALAACALPACSDGRPVPARDLRPAQLHIVVDEVGFTMPRWFSPADEAAFRAVAETYLHDASAALRGYWPAGAGDSSRALEIVIDGETGAGASYDAAERVARIPWPRGAKGRPRAVRPLPDLAWAVVQDRRRELGISPEALMTTLEAAAITRGRALPVTFEPADPSAYDFAAQPARP